MKTSAPSELSTLVVEDDGALHVVCSTLKLRGRPFALAARDTLDVALASISALDLAIVAHAGTQSNTQALCRALRAAHPMALVAAAGPVISTDTLSALLDAGAEAYLITTLGEGPLSMQIVELEQRALTRQREQKTPEQGPVAAPFRRLAGVMAHYCFRLGVDPDQTMRVEWIGPGFTELTGLTFEDVLVREGGHRLTHPTDDHLLHAWAKRLMSGQSAIVEHRLLREGGEMLWVRIFGLPLYEASQGRITGILGAGVDVTAEVHEREALRDEAAGLEAIVQHAPMAIVAVDYAGIVTRWNPAAERIFGWTATEAVGRRNPLIPEEKWESFQLFIENAFCGKLEENIEAERLCKGGGRITIAASRAVLRDAEGAPTGIVAMLADVTERKRLEAELRRADRLASIGRLAAAVGHEINNPLAYLLANLNLALEELDISDDTGHLDSERCEEVKAMLTEARDGAERVRHIMRDLKVFSQSEDNDRAPLDAIRVLDSCVQIAWGEIRHRARLTKRYEPTPRILTNETRLGQVLLNLIVNATYALPEGEAERNEIRLAIYPKDNGQVVIEVNDNGPQIPADDLEHIFEPFFAARDGTRGSGFGLSVCYSIVNALGGELTVESMPDRGTSFFVHLPAAKVDRAQVAARDASSPRDASSKARLLVIDDEAPVARAIARLLRDYEVTVADSGNAALLAIREGRGFDAILCDLLMPDLTGIEVYEHIRKEHPGLEERMIFMTGGTFTPRTAEFLAAIPNARLEKPFERAMIKSVLSKVLRK